MNKLRRALTGSADFLANKPPKQRRKYSIRKKTILLIVLTNVIPIFMLGPTAYALSVRLNMSQTASTYNQGLESYNAALGILYTGLNDTMQNILAGKKTSIYERDLIDILEIHYPQDSPYRHFQKAEAIGIEIYNLMQGNDQIEHIAVLDNSARLYGGRLTNNGFSPYYMEPAEAEKLISRIYIETAENKRGGTVYLGKRFLESQRETSFTVLKSLISPVDFSVLGTMIVQIGTTYLNAVFPNSDMPQEGTYVIVDNSNPEEQSIVYSIGSLNNIDELVHAFYSGATGLDSDYLVGMAKNPVTGWDFLYFADKKSAIASSNIIAVVFIILAVATVLFILVMARAMTTTIYKPLEQLRKTINHIALGDSLEVREEFGDDEIGQIGTEFKNLVEQNLLLKDKLYRSAIREKDAELKSFQAQINPHFLYNTLDSIYWSASLSNAHTAADMTLSLSRLMKTGIESGPSITTLKKELAIVQDYLYLCKMRFGDKLTYDIDVSDEILDCQILKLLLQPLVENAVLHGIESKLGDGRITLRGRALMDEVELSVSDNGVGIDLTKGMPQGFGLLNVKERVKLFYGNQYGVDMVSAVGVGTTVTIRLPRTLGNSE